MYTNLIKYGLTDRFKQEATMYDGLILARVSEQHRDLYKVISEQGELNAVVSGKMHYSANGTLDFPAVGDWVMLRTTDEVSDNAVIHCILSRKSLFTRQAAGTANEVQAIAANIDTIFICMSLNADYNLRRLERYLTVAWESMASPVIVLTKSDLCEDLPSKLAEIASVSAGMPVIACSSENGYGYDQINIYIEKGKTVAFIGSSGVGKSTLINRLIGSDVLKTRSIREDDDKGRHTTTYRQLLLLPGGGIVIDTPGMRELQLYAGDLSRTFADIEELAKQCKYNNCSHKTEPGCMVRKAIEDGWLSEKRFASYLKLSRELSYEGLNSRQTEQEKINHMFGSKNMMKQTFKQIKSKNKQW